MDSKDVDSSHFEDHCLAGTAIAPGFVRHSCRAYVAWEAWLRALEEEEDWLGCVADVWGGCSGVPLVGAFAWLLPAVICLALLFAPVEGALLAPRGPTRWLSTMSRAVLAVVAKAAVLWMGLSGTQRQVRLTATMVAIDVALPRPPVLEAPIAVACSCPVHVVEKLG